MNNQQRTSLIQLLLRVPGIQSYMTRTALLQGIPNISSLPRDEGNAHTDIDMLVSQLSKLFLASGEWALLILLENARLRTTGTTLDGELAALQQQLSQTQHPGTPSTPARPVVQPPPNTRSSAKDNDSITIFYCYAPEDAYYCRELEKHLASLRRQKMVNSWHGLNMQAGDIARDEMDRALRAADIVLLLISPDFMASDTLYEEQVQPALAQRAAGTTVVIPILVRDTEGWLDSDYGKLFALPRTGKSVKASGNSDGVFVSIARDIRNVVERLRAERKQGTANHIP
jgi:hypothetical protein